MDTPSATAKRRDCDSPSVIAKEGWRFHHIGIPTNVVRPGETHLPWLNVHVSGFESSPYGIQWMRFDKDAPFPDTVKSLPHVAFEVDDLGGALEGKEILVEPNCPCAGVDPAGRPAGQCPGATGARSGGPAGAGCCACGSRRQPRRARGRGSERHSPRPPNRCAG